MSEKTVNISYSCNSRLCRLAKCKKHFFELWKLSLNEKSSFLISKVFHWMNVKLSCQLLHCSNFELYNKVEIKFLKKKSNCWCQNTIIFARKYCDEIKFKRFSKFENVNQSCLTFEIMNWSQKQFNAHVWCKQQLTRLSHFFLSLFASFAIMKHWSFKIINTMLKVWKLSMKNDQAKKSYFSSMKKKLNMKSIEWSLMTEAFWTDNNVK